MSLTRDTSRFYQYWLDNVEPDLKETKEAIAQKDFKRMGEVIEANGLRMHATNLGAQPPFTYLVPESYMLCASFMNVEKRSYLATLQWTRDLTLKY